MDLARIIYFTDKIDAMTAFYRDVLGLSLVTDEPRWKELSAGPVRIALHAGSKGKANGHSPKIAFYCADVPALRQSLIDRGITMGKLWSGEITFSDGQDPDGNAFSISSR